MIVRILSRGSSFQGLTAYLTHDAEADTTERVGWTHTLNCANDHVPSVVNEMLWTARDAELLKHQAGVRAGGRATENTVKHLSLNWAPDQKPTREEMVETTEDFLRHMHWSEHQALLVAHTDKSYAHVHVMLNMIHPETGLRLDDNFERRRAQSWALEYERERGDIRCENRLLAIEDREPSPTRPAWQAFHGVRQDFEQQEQRRAAAAERDAGAPNPEIRGPAKEWEILKQMQRDERLGFFADGKRAFSEMRNGVYREVREEFRPRWADYYAAQRDGADPDQLKELKATLVVDQKAVLEERRDSAYAGLRETRATLYRELLDGQRDRRQELKARQAANFDSLDLMDWMRTDIPRARNDNDRAANDNSKAREAADVPPPRSDKAAAPVYGSGRSNGSMRSGADAGSRMADGFAVGLLQLCEFVANAFSPPSPQPEMTPPEDADDAFAEAAEDARQRQQYEQDQTVAREADEERLAQSARSQQ